MANQAQYLECDDILDSQRLPHYFALDSWYHDDGYGDIWCTKSSVAIELLVEFAEEDLH